MSVRFVIGRAGTGKTHHCVEAIRTGLRDGALDGPRLVFLVPEQASLQMERAIIDPAGGCGAAHRADVLSFQRLGVRVLTGVRHAERVALTESARSMVLRRLLTAHAGQLQYYGRAARGGRGIARVVGLVDRLSQTVSELIEEGADPDDLTRSLDVPGDSGELSPAQRAKMHDLALIYARYLDFLGDRFLDPARRLELATTHLPSCAWLRGAHVWVDGFASFSGLELNALIELARLSASVDITVLADPELAANASVATGGTGHYFSKTIRMFQNVHRALTAAGIATAPPLVLAPVVPPRFSRRPALARLERELFHTSAASGSQTTPDSNAVELVEAGTRRLEVDYAVAQVCAWVQDQEVGGRYRDVAIVTRDLETYHDLLSEALTARHVPYFVDRRRPIFHHPLVGMLRSMLGMGVERMSLSSVRAWLKCGLVPLPDAALDELENYLLAHGVEGVPAWSDGHWAHERLSGLDKRRSDRSAQVIAFRARVAATRADLWQRLAPWIDAMSGQAVRTSGDWYERIVGVLNRFDVPGQLARWSAEAEADGDLDLAEEHREVWKQVGSLLDDFRFSFADDPLTPTDLRDVLEAGLSPLTLGLVPPMIDQVLVGSIDRSRHPNIKCLIVLGLNDGVFPQKPSEDSILNDDDRRLLLDRGMRVGPPSRQVVADESMLAYIAVTRASERVVITWAATDADGKSLRESPFVGAIESAAGCVPRVRLVDPAMDRSCWDVLSGPDLTRRLAQEFRDRPPLGEDANPARITWNEIYRFGRDRRSRCDARSLSSLDDSGGAARLDVAMLSKLVRGTFTASVSSLETYAACPFQYFAKHVLDLRERQQRPLAVTDSGTIHHAVLEHFIQRLIERDASVSAISTDELIDHLNESCRAISDQLQSSDVVSGARDAYLLSRSAEQLGRVVDAQRRTIGYGRSRAKRAEAAFGFPGDDGLPGLSIHTPNGRRAALRGFIDRIDLAEVGDEYLGVVVDYKATKGKRLELDRVFHGLSLQLLAYLLVLAEHGETLAGRPIKPGGALYVGLTPHYEYVMHPSLHKPADAARRGMEKPRGWLSESVTTALEDKGEGHKSAAYAVYRDAKSGALNNLGRNDATSDDTFRLVLDHVRTKMGELVDGILDGDVSVRPYRLGTFSPCSWCTMSSVCRFEIGVCDTRRLSRMSRQLALAQFGGFDAESNQTR